jgi:hypothetical protein
MTLHVSWSRKAGLPNYSSLCASCGVEVELAGSMVFTDVQGFHCQARQAFGACREAVDKELALQLPGVRTAETVTGTAAPSGEGPSNGDKAARGNGQKASQRQIDYALQLARQITGLGAQRVDTLATEMFGGPVACLSRVDASTLISTLRAVRDGEIPLCDIHTDADECPPRGPEGPPMA